MNKISLCLFSVLLLGAAESKSNAIYDICPEKIPLINAEVVPSVNETQKGTYDYSVVNSQASSDHISMFSLMGVNPSSYKVKAPPDWHTYVGKNVVRFFPTKPYTGGGETLSPLFASDADIAPGSRRDGFRIVSNEAYGLVLYKLGIRRDIDEQVRLIDGSEKDADADEGEYAAICGGNHGALRSIFSYGVTWGPSNVSVVTPSKIYKAPVGLGFEMALPLGTAILSGLNASIYNAERNKKYSITILEYSVSSTPNVVRLRIDSELLKTFSCRTVATLVELSIADRPVFRGAISGSDLGLPKGCLK